MQQDKGDLVPRCEQYARWTIPAICPEGGVINTTNELLRSFVIIGPRIVNNLSNKIVEVMFPQSRPFFSVTLSPDVKQKIRQEAGDDALAEIADTARAEARWLEEYAVSKMNLVQYRPVAVDVAQQLIVCGNVLLRRMPNGRRVAYNVRNYCVRRLIDGEVSEIITEDMIDLEDLSEKDKAKLVEAHKAAERDLTSESSNKPKTYQLYTRFYRNAKGRWTQEQECNGITVGTVQTYTDTKFPCIALAWSLRRGENYGRGLVEEHRVVFQNLDRTGEALFDLFEIAAEIKFLVRAGSLVDVAAMNKSKRGSYHTGQEGDVTAVQVNKYNDLQVIISACDRMERELSYAFLSGAGMTRDAERVTALEIQQQAMELETAFGGLYSRLALEWQQREAEYAIASLNQISLGGKRMFDVTITTGLESLSREGELQNFRLAIADLALLDGVPEDMRASINPDKVARFLFGQRGVKFAEFMYTADERKAIQQQQSQQLQQEQAMAVEGEAAKAAAKDM